MLSSTKSAFFHFEWITAGIDECNCDEVTIKCLLAPTQNPHREIAGHVCAGDKRQGHRPPPACRKHRADRHDVQPRHVVADHQHTGQIANRPTRQCDPDAEAPQQQPAVNLPGLRPAR